MVFDTTSATTGNKTAGCVAAQELLKRELLWFACRHHIGEVLLKHVWHALKVEVAKKLEVTVFERFKENFDKLTHSDMSGLDFPLIDEQLADMKNEITGLCKMLLKQKSTRGNYKELVTLVLLYLSDDKGENFGSFNRPVACHKARWMAKLLYAIKMVLLATKIREELPKGAVFASQQLKKLNRFVQFAIFCYFPWWTTAPVSSSAPSNDLLLLKSLYGYRKVEKVCADAAINAFSNHLWYLTEEFVMLGLFSSRVPLPTKVKMVEKLKSVDKRICSKRYGPLTYGKPPFPRIPVNADVNLSEFVGEDSWSFFHLLKINTGFLYLPAKDWSSNPQFQAAKEVVASYSVANDGAERGVKLSHDFLEIARKEDNLQNILQVVENDRRPIREKERSNPSAGSLNLSKL